MISLLAVGTLAFFFSLSLSCPRGVWGLEMLFSAGGTLFYSLLDLGGFGFRGGRCDNENGCRYIMAIGDTCKERTVRNIRYGK